MRLVDIDTLDENVEELISKGWYITRGDYKTISSVLFELPVVDAKPVVHGRWDCSSGLATCTACGKRPRDFYIDGSEKWPYCPLCGARMKPWIFDD